MPVTKSQLDYWNGSAWVTAETPADNNALISFSTEEKMGQPMACSIKVSNKFNNPFSATQSDFKGKLSGVFTDFQRIRVIDSGTRVVLFYGRIYKTVEKYDLAFGNVIDIEALDALAELKDMVTDGHDDITMTTSGDTYPTIASPTTAVGKRSGLIKGFLSLFAKSGNITFTGDSNRFNESVTTFSKAGEYPMQKGGQKSVLAHINAAAKDDPQDSAKKTLTYDYYVDPNFQSNADSHEPAAFFNYFKRGERPSTTPETYSLRIEYPTGGGLTRTGRIYPMMADYDFSRPKTELFTDAVCHYVDEGPDTVGGATNKDKGFDIEEKLAKLELVKVKSISGSFVWAGKAIGGGTTGVDSAEEVKSGSTVVGRIQFISATSGGSDGSPEYALISDATSDFPATGTITGATTTGSSFQIVSRNSTTFGINKTARLGASNVENADIIREQAVSRLRRSSDSILRGRFRIVQKPWFYLDSGSTSVSSNTITFADLNPLSYGFRIGMTVNKVSSTGVVQSYGYATAVTANSVTTAGMSSSIATGDIIRLYVPVRASDSCYVINRLVNITGGNFEITGVRYTEDNGVMSTELEVVWSNSRLGPVNTPTARLISVVSEKENYTQPSGGTAQSAKAKLTSKFSHHSSNKHTTIAWTAGQLTVGANAYAISVGTQVFGSTGEHYLYYTGSGTGFSTSTVAAYTTNKDHTLVCWINVLSTSDNTQWLEFKALGDLNTSVPDKGKASSTVNERTIKPTDKLTTEGMEYFNAQVVLKATGDNVIAYGANGTSVVSSFPITFADGTSVTITSISNPAFTLTSAAGVDNYIYVDISNTSLNITTTYSSAVGDTKLVIATCERVPGYDALVFGKDSAASGGMSGMRAAEGKVNTAFDSNVEFDKNFELTTNDTYLNAAPVLRFGVGLPGISTATMGLHLSQGNATGHEQPLLFVPTLGAASSLGFIQFPTSGVQEDDMVIGSNQEIWLKSYTNVINMSNTDTTTGVALKMIGMGSIQFYHSGGNFAGFGNPVSNPSSSYLIHLPTAVPTPDKILKSTSGNGLNFEWVDMPSGTTYSAGTGLTLSSTTFSVTADTYAAYSHSHNYAASSHSHSYDNYVSWRYRTDTSSYEDVISNESVSIRGGDDIDVTHTGGTITIDYTGSGGGSGTINSGSTSRLAYYTGSTTLDDVSYFSNANQIGDASDSVYLFYTDNADIGALNVSGTSQAVRIASLYGISSGTTVLADGSNYIYKQSSSERYKANIRPLETDSTQIYSLVGKTFEAKPRPDGTTESGTFFGLIAEEVYEILPDLVVVNNENQPDSVQYQNISVLLLEEMKKLKARIEVLEGN